MAGSSLQDSIMEEREEEMISPTGGYPTFRTAHFLKPSIITSPDSQLQPLPPHTAAVCGGSPPPLKVTYHGWTKTHEGWANWVDSMRLSHESTWRRAGISEALLNSKCKIHRCDGLILALAGKWCSETNTFLFPWGEATLTLEDMVVLGGFSVSGCSVDPNLSPISYRGSESTKQKLIQERKVIYNTSARKVTQSLWIGRLMNSGRDIEHEAFLVYWLERFVFPTSYRASVGVRNTLDMAAVLAQGERIALAPAVLASIYRNLTLLRNARDQGGEIEISAPFELVQIWAWERFPALQPNSNVKQHELSRFVRWDEVKMKARNVAMAFDDSDGDCFLWRPYTIGAKDAVFPKEIDELAKWLRVSELDGIEDCIEQYLPHRVAMQFGFDQDIPGHVARVNQSPEAAWEFFTRPVLESKLYVPPRSFESDVTTRYLDWWKKSRECCRTSDDNGLSDDDIPLIEIAKRRKIARSCTNLAKNVARTCNNTTQPADKQPENQDVPEDGLIQNNGKSTIQEDCDAENLPKDQDIPEDKFKENNGTSNIPQDCVEEAKNLTGKRRCKVDPNDLEKRISNLEKIFAFIRRK